MKTKLTSADQLKAGDKIFRVDSCNYEWQILEFVCVHPHSDYLVIMLDDTTLDPIRMSKFELEHEDWYIFDDHSWSEIYATLAVMHQRESEHYKSLALLKLEQQQ